GHAYANRAMNRGGKRRLRLLLTIGAPEFVVALPRCEKRAASAARSGIPGERDQAFFMELITAPTIAVSTPPPTPPPTMSPRMPLGAPAPPALPESRAPPPTPPTIPLMIMGRWPMAAFLNAAPTASPATMPAMA